MINRKKFLLRSYSKSESKFNWSEQLDRLPSSKSLRMHSRCGGCLDQSYSWNAFTVLSMKLKCTNNEIYIVLISLHIVMHWISSWTQQQHWNYRQTASQGCSTSCLCWFCDCFKAEFWILSCRKFTSEQNTESPKNAALSLHQLITFCWRRPIFQWKLKMLSIHIGVVPCGETLMLWAVAVAGHIPHCWSALRLLHTAATLFQIYLLYCIVCPVHATSQKHSVHYADFSLGNWQ